MVDSAIARALLTHARADMGGETSDRFGPVLQWGRNRLVEEPRGIVELPPTAVREMAALPGCAHAELARYLARFPPACSPSHPARRRTLLARFYRHAMRSGMSYPHPTDRSGVPIPGEEGQRCHGECELFVWWHG